MCLSASIFQHTKYVGHGLCCRCVIHMLRNSEDEPHVISLRPITNHLQSQLQLIQAVINSQELQFASQNVTLWKVCQDWCDFQPLNGYIWTVSHSDGNPVVLSGKLNLQHVHQTIVSACFRKHGHVLLSKSVTRRCSPITMNRWITAESV